MMINKPFLIGIGDAINGQGYVNVKNRPNKKSAISASKRSLIL